MSFDLHGASWHKSCGIACAHYSAETMDVCKCVRISLLQSSLLFYGVVDKVANTLKDTLNLLGCDLSFDLLCLILISSLLLEFC